MSAYVVAPDGNRLSVPTAVSSDRTLCLRFLRSNGYDVSEDYAIVISGSKDQPHKHNRSLDWDSIEGIERAIPQTIPDRWEPSDKDDFSPPRESDRSLWGLFDWKDPYMLMGDKYVSYNTWWDRFKPPIVRDETMASWYVYWQLLDADSLDPGASFSRKVTSKTGISEQTEVSLSAKLGIPISKLSLELSASFKHSITVTSEEIIEKNYSYSVPEGKVAFVTFWQLVDVFHSGFWGPYIINDTFHIGPFAVAVELGFNVAQPRPQIAFDIALMDA